jgi:glycerol kinase
LGAAYLGGLAVGFWKNSQEVAAQWKIEKVFEPKMPESQVRELRARWQEALARSKNWETPRNALTKSRKKQRKMR